MSKLTRVILKAAGVDITMGDCGQYTLQPTDDGPRVHRECSGEYTIEEVRGMLRDMEAIQAAFDAGKLRRTYVTVDVSAYVEEHGREPAGPGVWGFLIGKETFWASCAYYAGAREEARARASEVGCTLVTVLE